MTEAKPLEHSLPPHRYLIWIIPIVAALIGGWLVVQKESARGPTITIQFRSAEGLSPGHTVLRYKDVDVGTLTSIRISRQGGITAIASMTRDAEPFLNKDSRFWGGAPAYLGRFHKRPGHPVLRGIHQLFRRALP